MLKLSEIKHFIEEDRTSRKKKMAEQGQKYYEGEHKIMGSLIFYIDADGNVKEDTLRSNVKISHPFFTELVDQEVQYMLSGDENFIKSDNPELQKQLELYFNDSFWSEVYEMLTGCISKGFDYMYAYKSVNGRLKFQHADSMGVVEVQAKYADDNEDHVIYWYIDRIEKGNKVIKRIQVWDKKETYYYKQVNDGKIVEDDQEELNPRPHIVTENEKGERFGSS